VSASSGQNATVKGKVKDAFTGKRSRGEHHGGYSRGTATDDFGNYELQLPAGQVRIFFRFVGYKEEYVNLDLQSDTTVQMDINLQSQAIELTTAVVSASAMSKGFPM